MSKTQQTHEIDSSPGTGGVDQFSKESCPMPEFTMKIAAQFIHNLQLGPSAIAIRTFIDSRNKWRRAAALHALLSVHMRAPPVKTLVSFAASFPDIATLFSTLSGSAFEIAESEAGDDPDEDTFQNIEVTATYNAQAEEVATAVSQEPSSPSKKQVLFNPREGSASIINSIKESLPNCKTLIASFLQKHTTAIRIVGGILAVVCGLFGIDKVLSTDLLSDMPKRIAKLSAVLLGGKVIWQSASAIMDTVLPVVYGFFGETYVSDKHQKIKHIADEVEALYALARDTIQAAKIDFFGLQREGISGLEDRFAKINKAYQFLEEKDRSMYNFHNRMSQIQTYINELNDMIFDIYKTRAGKQQPTTLWISGGAGIGKTDKANDISTILAARHGGAVYQNTSGDKFHSGYQHQVVFSFDDIGQNVDGEDIVQFHRYSSKDAKDVIGAAIGDKGKPFTSLYMVMTSNFQYIAPPTPLKDYEALNRRRDICIYAYNPAVSQYKLQHDGLSPDAAFFRANPTRYFLYNPVYGVTNGGAQANLANFPFSPDAPWVIREVSVEEIIEGMYHLQQSRAENFRQKLYLSNDTAKFPVTSEPIRFDPEKFIHKPGKQVMRTNPAVAPSGTDIDRMRFEMVTAFKSTDLKCIADAFMMITNQHGVIPTQDRKEMIDLLDRLSMTHDVWMSERGQLFHCLGAHPQPTPSMVEELINAHLIKFIIDIDNDEEGVTAKVYMPPTDVYQNSPAHKVIVTTTSPAILIAGPPGVGKTYVAANVKDAHVWDWESAIPLDKIIILDDFTLSEERFHKAKTVLADFHDRQKYRFVIATLNDNSAIWTNALADDRNLILRRSHFVHINFSNRFRMTNLMKKVNSSSAITQIDAVDREKHLVYKFSYAPGATALAHLQPCLGTLKQLINLSVADACKKKETIEYENFTLPAPPQPDLHVILDDAIAPTFAGSQFLKHTKDGYVPLSATELLTCAAMFTGFIRRFSQYTIADRAQAPSVVNSHACSNKTRFKDILISSNQWAIGVTTINNKLIAYSIEDDDKFQVEIQCGSYILNGKLYHIDTQFDADIATLVGRNCGKMNDMLRELNNTQFEIPDIQVTASKTNVWQWLDNIVAVIDICCCTFAATTLFMKDDPEPEENTEEFERSKRNVVKKSMKCPSCGSPDSPNHKCREAKDKYQRSKRGRQTETKKCPTCGSPDSPNHKCRDPKTKYESADYSLDSPNWAIAAKPGNDGEWYGVLTAGRFYWMEETRENRWYGFVCDAADLDLKIIEDLGPKTRDSLLLQSILGQVINMSNPDIDVGLVIADYLAKGIRPTDPDLVHFVDKILPKPYADRSEKEQQGLKSKYEAMYDPQADDTLDVLMKNKIQVVTEDGDVIMSAMRLWDDLILTNNHIPEGAFFQIAGKAESATRIASSSTNDIALFRLNDKSIPSCKSIRKHIATVNELGKHLSLSKGRIAVQVGLGTYERTKVHTATSETFTTAISSAEEAGVIRYYQKIAHFGYTGVTRPGDCGSPVVLLAPTMNHKFIGIHSKGRVDCSSAAPITIEYLDALLSKSSDDTFQAKINGGMRRSDYIDYFPDEDTYHDAHLGAKVIGKPTHTVHVPKSTTKYLSPLRLPITSQPALLSKFDERNVQQQDPLIHGFSKYSQPQTVELDSEEINQAAEAVGTYIADKMISHGLTTRLMSTTEAINGAPNQEYPMSKSIDRSGSVGYPYTINSGGKNTKQQFLIQREDLKWYFNTSDPASQRILADVDLLMADAALGVHHDVPWTAYSKDEPVKLKKIYDLNAAKTRVFFAGPMSYQLAYRRAFYAAICRITELHAQIPVKVGINPLSLEWQNLAQQHLSKSQFGFDSDMKNWDGSVPIEFIRAVPIVYNTIYRLTDPDWKSQDDVLRNALHKPIEGATVIIYDKVYKLDHAMASGCPGTAIENSLINWMLFYLCWKRVMTKHSPTHADFQSFMTHSQLSVYGDDNIFTCSDALAPYFHFNSFRVEAAKFGIMVTDAQKSTGGAPDRKPFVELTFLKRSFLKRGWQYLPALEIDSIEKSLIWTRDAPAYVYNGEWRRSTNPEIFVTASKTSFAEMSLWGEEEYTKLATKCRRAAWGTGVVFPIPTFSESFAQSGLQ